MKMDAKENYNEVITTLVKKLGVTRQDCESCIIPCSKCGRIIPKETSWKWVQEDVTRYYLCKSCNYGTENTLTLGV